MGIDVEVDAENRVRAITLKLDGLADLTVDEHGPSSLFYW